jgi:hypothetical protein
MTPSSRLALAAAILLFVGAGLIYARSQDTRAPALTKPVVESMLRKGARAIERRSAAQVLDLTTDDAVLLGLKRAQMAHVISRSARDLSPGRFRIEWRDLVVSERGNVGTAEFEVSVRESLPAADAEYLTTHVTLDLVKVRRSSWLGLGSAEVWLVRRAESSTDLMLRD